MCGECRGERMLVYDLITGQGVVSSRAVFILRSVETSFDWFFLFQAILNVVSLVGLGGCICQCGRLAGVAG